MAVETATSLQLDPAISQRLRQLAESRHLPPEVLAQEAVEQYLTRAERREEFRSATLAASEHYRTTGLHVTQEEMEEWALKIEAGEDVPMPECHV